jgi:predicted alpha/beta-fold hydrolase
MRVKARQHPDRVSAAPLSQIRTLRGFDDAYTAPLHGFDGADDYYRRASSKPLLSKISVPTLLLNAANDPFLPPSCYPRAIARKHDPLTLEVPESGGHVGFVTFNHDGEYWSERRTLSFLSSLDCLEENPD